MADYSQLTFVDWAKRIKLANSGQTNIQLAGERHKKEIQLFLSVKHPNIFEDTLRLMETMYDESYRNPRLGSIGVKFMVLSELKQFVKNNPNLNAPLTLRTQMSALVYAISKKNRSWVETTFEAYKLSTVPEDEINNYVNKLISEKWYADAAYIVVQRKLQTKRDLKDIAVPLLLEDKINVLEYYIASCPQTASKFISYLDNVKTSYDIIEALAEGTAIDPSKVKSERFASRTFNKLITRLMKKYNITADCPVTAKETKFRAIKFLVYKRFVEASISEDCFREGVYKAVEDCKDLVNDVIDLLIRHKAINEAVKFADYFNVPDSHRPSELYSTSLPTTNTSYASNDWDPESLDDSWPTTNTSKGTTYAVGYDPYDGYDDDEEDDGYCDVRYRMSVFNSLTSKDEKVSPDPQYLHLRLDAKDVHFVKTAEDFDKAIESIMCYNVIGIDCEWKPMLGAVNVSSVQMVEIMQIATWDDCYLIDVQQLKNLEAHWKCVCKDIFSSKKIMKIGFGIKSDWKNINATLPKNVFTPPVNVLDLTDFSEWFFLKYNGIVDKDRAIPKDVKGLSKLTYLVLGKYINKEEQFSDWGRRPLRDNQIKYAAIDAYSLLQIYEELYNKSLQQGIDFEENVLNFISGKVSAEDILLLRCEFSLNSKEDEKFEETPIRYFKCIADAMFQGLGKNLRVCGADVKLLEGNEFDQEITEYARKNNAIFLTSGHRYDYWKNKLDTGKCCRVANTITGFEQLKVIVKKFNLIITEKDLLSRCVKCNSNYFEEILSKALRNMFERKVNTYRNVKLKFEGLHSSKFDSISLFYICIQCGQIYWEGCHHSRLKSKVQEVLFTDDSNAVPMLDDSPGKKIVSEVITIDDDD